MGEGRWIFSTLFFLKWFYKEFSVLSFVFQCKKKRERKQFVSGRLSKLTVTETRTMEQTGSESTGFGSFLFVCLFVVVFFWKSKHRNVLPRENKRLRNRPIEANPSSNDGEKIANEGSITQAHLSFIDHLAIETKSTLEWIWKQKKKTAKNERRGKRQNQLNNNNDDDDDDDDDNAKKKRDKA